MGQGVVPVRLRAALDALVAEAAAAGGEMALVVRHLDRAERLEQGAEVPFKAASTIKLPILVALYDAASRGRLRLDAQVRLRSEDQVTGSGVLQVLSPGVRLSLRDLAELMIVVSDNTATNMLLDHLGVLEVNACIQALGLRGTRVVRPLQVIPAGAIGSNTVTAVDLADLLVLIARGQAVSWEASRRMVATLKRQQINDALPALLPDPEDGPEPLLGAVPAWEMAHKTGGISGYQHDVGILYLPVQTIVVCVLTRGCGTAAAARQLIARVGRAVWEAYAGVGA
jgi:beta-lactamase class A